MIIHIAHTGDKAVFLSFNSEHIVTLLKHFGTTQPLLWATLQLLVSPDKN